MALRRILVLGWCWCLLSSGVLAQPDASATARADELFKNGKMRIAEGDFAAACEMFSESGRLAPGSGVLLALAICHEREGKLGSALREYQRMLESANVGMRPDRVAAARERVEALRSVVSTVTIELVPQAPGVQPQVSLNGQTVVASEFGQPLPVDGGDVRVVATAPGTRAFSTTFVMQASGATQLVRVPRLEPPAEFIAIARIPIVRPMPSKQIVPSTAPDSLPLTPRDWIGIGALGAGLAILGAGGLLTLRAIHDNNVADSGCNRKGCVGDPADKPLRLQTAEKSTLAVGAVLTVVGSALLALRLRAKHDERTAATATPWIGPASAGATFHAHF